MFKFEEICELIRLVGSTQVASVEVEHAGSRIKIEGPQRAAAPAPPSVATVPLAPLYEGTAPPALPTTGREGAEPDEEATLHRVTSPIVGTFYRAPNPDSEPYAKVGDFVDKGQVLCIVEAMKLMNEIESDVAGTVVRVVPQNAQPVEFGSALFLIRPA